MTDAAKMARREYYRRWRKENKERIRQQAEKFWERKAQQQGEGNENQ